MTIQLRLHRVQYILTAHENLVIRIRMARETNICEESIVVIFYEINFYVGT